MSGSQLTSIFSAQIDDAVASTLHYPEGTAQIVSNWSDESQRKMTTKVTLWGTTGGSTPTARRSRSTCATPRRSRRATGSGWNVRYTTELTEAPWFYLRGEEYSAQLDAFVQRVIAGRHEGDNDFASAAVTDRVISMISEDAARDKSRQAQRGRDRDPADGTRRRIGAALRALRGGMR